MEGFSSVMLGYWLFTSILLFIFLAGELLFLKKLKLANQKKLSSLTKDFEELSLKENKYSNEINDIENVLSERFLFYDTARKIAPCLDHKHLRMLFAQEIRYLGQIEDIVFFKEPQDHGYKKYKFGKSSQDVLYVKTRSTQVLEYLPYFTKLLGLCFQRIKLYDKLQELSIHDSLTKIYNRRYFTIRYLEEFSRAKRMDLDISFLMIDIDNFKKINDSLGHLAGDVVLRKVADLIRETMRELDFVARYGGEEFAVILPETDKAGAIMVAERISAKVSRERIKAFDEILSVSVSAGVGSFPHNTLHSDVLVEIADKALYKAKISGRNRVCWF